MQATVQQEGNLLAKDRGKAREDATWGGGTRAGGWVWGGGSVFWGAVCLTSHSYFSPSLEETKPDSS